MRIMIAARHIVNRGLLAGFLVGRCRRCACGLLLRFLRGLVRGPHHDFLRIRFRQTWLKVSVQGHQRLAGLLLVLRNSGKQDAHHKQRRDEHSRFGRNLNYCTAR